MDFALARKGMKRDRELEEMMEKKNRFILQSNDGKGQSNDGKEQSNDGKEQVVVK